VQRNGCIFVLTGPTSEPWSKTDDEMFSLWRDQFSDFEAEIDGYPAAAVVSIPGALPRLP
jgi:hypothetical protein